MVISCAGSTSIIVVSRRAGDSCHLREPADGIGHEMHNQLGQRAVEGAVSERKPLGNPAMHADPRETVADRRGERGGRIDCRNTAAA